MWGGPRLPHTGTPVPQVGRRFRGLYRTLWEAWTKSRGSCALCNLWNSEDEDGPPICLFPSPSLQQHCTLLPAEAQSGCGRQRLVWLWLIQGSPRREARAPRLLPVTARSVEVTSVPNPLNSPPPAPRHLYFFLGKKNTHEKSTFFSLHNRHIRGPFTWPISGVLYELH